MKARTVAICVCIALIGAIIAGLVANALIGDDDGNAKEPSSGVELTEQPDPDAALEAKLLTLDGQPTTLNEQLTDKPMVINLWAQSCAPCVKEMPLLEQASKDNPGIAFLGVDTQDQLDKATAMAKRTGITYPWLQDKRGDFFYAVRAAGMPTTLAVNPEGEILASHTGAFKSQKQLQTWIEDYLGTGTTPP